MHWVLGDNFNQDASRLHKVHADQNMSAISRIALSLIKLDPDKKKSQQVKRKKTGRGDSFRASSVRI